MSYDATMGVVTFTEAGVWDVSFGLPVQDTAAFGPTLNGVQQGQGVHVFQNPNGSGVLPTVLQTVRCLIVAAIGDTLDIRNLSGLASRLTSGGGITAFLTIVKAADV